MTREEKACEIVNNFKGATVDHFGCCLMQEQIVKALASAEKKAWNEAIDACIELVPSKTLTDKLKGLRK